MRRTHITVLSLLTLVALAALTACSSDSTTAPSDPPERQAGYVYHYAGTGAPALGAEGQRPENTALYWPQDMSFDAQGTPHIVDWNNHRILREEADGSMHVLIGGQFGDAPDGQARDIGLNHPTYVTFDAVGNLILSAWHNSLLKRMNVNTGYIQTFCGDGSRTYNGDGIAAELATLDLPVNAIFDSQGRMFVTDQGSMIVRMIDTNGVIHTIAGKHPEWVDNGAGPVYVRYPGYSGDGGPADEAQLNIESGQAAQPAGKICFDRTESRMFIADTKNHVIRCIDMATMIISTYAGTGEQSGFDGDNGPATSALMREPRDVAWDPSDDVLYIADTGNHCIRMVDADGVITTIAGKGATPGAEANSARASAARFTFPFGIEMGPDGNLWIADTNNHVIRILYL